MNKYEQVPDEVVDLHGLTKSEAEVVLRRLIAVKKPRHIRVITGKALYRKDGPVLRTFVKNFLIKNGIKFNPSKIKDGGDGALEVWV